MAFSKKYLKQMTKNFIAPYVGDPFWKVARVRPLSANEKKAIQIMERHLSGYTGILAHSTWKGLRDDIVYWVEKRRVRKVK